MDAANTAISLFQFSIDTLGRIKLARAFRDDFEAHQLKLDILRLRLSRWGEIASIGTIDDSKKYENKDGCDLNKMKEILQRIGDRLNSTSREAKRVQKNIDAKDTQVLDPDSCLPQDLKRVRNWFMQFLRKRKVQASVATEAIKWVFYKQEHFQKFVEHISELLDGLDQVLPEDKREKLRQLSDEECKGISKAHLEELKGILHGCDPWLETSMSKSMEADEVATIINQSHNTGSTVGIHRGDNNGVTNGSNSTQTNTFHPRPSK